MNDRFSDECLRDLSQVVADQTALHFSRERWPDLERGIRSVAPKLGHPDIETCVRRLLSIPLSRKETEILAGELTVGETYFFREKRSFEILSDQIIPELARLRQKTERRLRIWSAGCCTGEEPYSIAILLDRILPDLSQWQVTILGTDINPYFLKKASAGIYGEWSFRDAPPWLKSTYFKQIDSSHYEISSSIRERVRFEYLNLAEDNYPSLATNTNAMDLIFCRNVLMYFSPERVKRIAHNFRCSLVENGWLLVSPTETSSELFAAFNSIPFDGATFYRKGPAPFPAGTTPPAMATSVAIAPGWFKVEETVSTPSPLEFIPPLPSTWIEPIVETPAEDSGSTPYDEALALFNLGHYEQAALKLESDLSAVSLKEASLRARICANLGDLAQALVWVEKALETDKLDAGLHYLRAVILEEQGAKEEALAAIKRTLYLDQNFVLAHYSLGNYALRQKNFREAERHFANAQVLLKAYQRDDVLPYSDGLAAGRLQEMIESAMTMEQIV